MVGGSPMFSYFKSIPINHVIPEHGVPLYLGSFVPSYSIGVEVCSKDGAALSNDTLPDILLDWSLSQLPVSLLVNIDDPLNHLPAPSDVCSNDIVVNTSS
jgi:hypothetical protein